MLESFVRLIVQRQLISILHALLVLTVEQEQRQACRGKKDGIKPPVEKLKLKLSSKCFCDDSSAKHKAYMNPQSLLTGSTGHYKQNSKFW